MCKEITFKTEEEREQLIKKISNEHACSKICFKKLIDGVYINKICASTCGNIDYNSDLLKECERILREILPKPTMENKVLTKEEIIEKLESLKHKNKRIRNAILDKLITCGKADYLDFYNANIKDNQYTWFLLSSKIFDVIKNEHISEIKNVYPITMTDIKIPKLYKKQIDISDLKDGMVINCDLLGLNLRKNIKNVVVSIISNDRVFVSKEDTYYNSTHNYFSFDKKCIGTLTNGFMNASIDPSTIEIVETQQEKKIIELSDLKDGTIINCTLKKGELKEKIVKGIISINITSHVYVCHNISSYTANYCDDMKGRKYSWCINNRNIIDPRNIIIDSIEIVDDNKSVNIKAGTNNIEEIEMNETKSFVDVKLKEYKEWENNKPNDIKEQISANLTLKVDIKTKDFIVNDDQYNEIKYKCDIEDARSIYKFLHKIFN